MIGAGGRTPTSPGKPCAIWRGSATGTSKTPAEARPGTQQMRHRRCCRKLNEDSLFGGHSMTLGNTAAAQVVRLLVWCRDCLHQVEPDLPGKSACYGADLPVIDSGRRHHRAGRGL